MPLKKNPHLQLSINVKPMMSLSIKLFGLSLRLLPSYLHISTSLLRERAGCIILTISILCMITVILISLDFLYCNIQWFLSNFFFFMKRLLSCTEREKRTWLPGWNILKLSGENILAKHRACALIIEMLSHIEMITEF